MILLCSACTTSDYSDDRTRYIYIERNPFWYHTPSHYYHHDNYRHNRNNHQDNISRPSPSRPSRPTPISVYPPPVSNPDRAPASKSPHDPWDC